MAKQAKAEAVEVAPQEVAVKTAPKKPAKPSWEIKDRVYYLLNNDYLMAGFQFFLLLSSIIPLIYKK